MTIGVQEPPLLRTVIAASAALTLLYTPVLKQLTWIKNACVAAVVAASPFAGALAARAVSPETFHVRVNATTAGQEVFEAPLMHLAAGLSLDKEDGCRQRPEIVQVACCRSLWASKL